MKSGDDAHGRTGRGRQDRPPTKTEVPAGPGDAGASDAPELLEAEPAKDPARIRTDRVLVRLLWAEAVVAIIIALIIQV